MSAALTVAGWQRQEFSFGAIAPGVWWYTEVLQSYFFIIVFVESYITALS